MEATRPSCTIDGCTTTKIEARGWCKKHYRRWQAHGDPNWEPPTRPTVCTIDDCGKPVIARGWCHAHWSRWKRYGDPTGGGPDRQPLPERCQAADDCTNPPFGRGMCKTHWRRDRAVNDPEAHERELAYNRRWHAENPDLVAEQRRRSRAKNRDTINARIAAWRIEHPERILLNNWRSRRRRYGLPDNVVDVVDPRVVFDRDGGICQLCGDLVDPDLPATAPGSATVDHVVPVVDPASEHSYANTQLAHANCNRSKAARALTTQETP